MPFATPERAAEIALMDEFGLAEFTELTGVGVGAHGIYRVSRKGVSLPASKNLSELTAAQQNAIHHATRLLTIRFPCAPADFMRWYDATRGKAPPDAPKTRQGISDFPLAKGFAEELRRHEEPSSDSTAPLVPSGEIVAAFKVLPADRENAEWWNLRLRNPGRYRLTSARAVRGAAQRPSYWHPVRVAAWLVEEELLTREVVIRAMQKSFPNHDADFLQV